MNGNYVKKKLKCTIFNWILYSIFFIIRLQETHQKLFTKNLHTYIETDEDLMKNIIDLSIYRQEKQMKTKHKRLEIETSRGNPWKQMRLSSSVDRYSSYSTDVSITRSSNKCSDKL